MEIRAYLNSLIAVSSYKIEFFGTDMRILLDKLYSDMAPVSLYLGCIILAVAFLGWISVFLLLLIINKYKKKREEIIKYSQI